MAYSALEISGNGSFNSRSRGGLSASIFVAGPIRLGQLSHVTSDSRSGRRLLPTALTDVDGNAEDRRGTVSVFNGPPPEIETFDDPERESEAVGVWITGRVKQGVQPHEIGLFVRSARELRRARDAVKRAGISTVELSDKAEITPGKLSIGTMHLAKGLEFRAVAVMACDDEIIPSQERIENVADDADLEEVYDSERHLLYVACTRARDHLLVTGVKPASEYLDDLTG
jgi:superfamily I DNA/RNA helicase